ncbi:tetratricopeptide repeat protein [Bauldia litoralis]|uniref:TPR repeat n=1 Tax=Bauldia litoralis TaxID=665467 RepID=A0A1G6CG15_9HYPH|nr:sel1 repeat family protein [Bauldia litoralis]SDB31856.1 TPR repeat [Bauldia litoralis]
MARPFPILALAALVALSVPAVAETDAEKEARIKVAIEVCDKGAAVPLDPTATAAPVQFQELVDPLNPERLQDLVATCREAMIGALGETRLTLQYLRSAFALSPDGLDGHVPEIRDLAASGSAEAKFLLYLLYRIGPADAGVDREEAVTALTAAADAGHQSALRAALSEYRTGPNVVRDPKRAAAYAESMMNLPQQGPRLAGASEAWARDWGRKTLGAILVTADGFDDAERARGFAIVSVLYEAGDQALLVPYLTALRFGRGTPQDAARARDLAERAVAAGRASAVSVLAGMLAEGEGGTVDGNRAIALLIGDLGRRDRGSNALLARLYLDNRFTGPRPRDAARVLAVARDLDSIIAAAPLLVDYSERIGPAHVYENRLEKAAEVGEPGAAMALARLRFSNHPDFGNDDSGARAVLAPLAAAGDREAQLLLVETQYGDLGASSFNPRPRGDAMSDDAARALIEDGIAADVASAFRVKGRFQRVGVVYPQDDAAATQSLLAAADRGDVEAMVLLGAAYDDGLGTAKNPRERLRWWREAARLGSFDAREKLARAFTFDSFDKLMTLREGVTERLALYNNGGSSLGFGTPMELLGMFSGGRARDAGTAALADAVMDAFRLAPAGLEDARLVPLIRVLPDEIRVAIEAQLKRDGFFAGSPEGVFGPEVRAALAKWVDASGPLPDEDVVAAEGPTSAETATTLPVALVDRVRDRVFMAAMRKDLTEAERNDVITGLNALAAYGDIPARWALVRNYHQASFIRDIVTAAEITRYGLDILVTRPEGVEKAEFEFVFDLTAMHEAGTLDAFGAGVVDAVRDDQRLQDPLTLGSITQQFIFAPGACDAIQPAMQAAGASVDGDDGCGEVVMQALIAFARSAGASGVDARAREAAAAELARLDAAAK